MGTVVLKITRSERSFAWMEESKYLQVFKTLAPFRHPDTIFNPFWAFITPILSLRYHFQPIFGFHHTHFVIKVPF